MTVYHDKSLFKNRGVESGWAIQYGKWEGERMFSPPPPPQIIVLKILNFSILTLLVLQYLSG